MQSQQIVMSCEVSLAANLLDPIYRTLQNNRCKENTAAPGHL